MTPRQKQVLKWLADGEEMVWDTKVHMGYVGNRRIRADTVSRLIVLMAVRTVNISGNCEYFEISQRGRELLEGK